LHHITSTFLKPLLFLIIGIILAKEWSLYIDFNFTQITLIGFSFLFIACLFSLLKQPPHFIMFFISLFFLWLGFYSYRNFQDKNKIIAKDQVVSGTFKVVVEKKLFSKSEDTKKAVLKVTCGNYQNLKVLANFDQISVQNYLALNDELYIDATFFPIQLPPKPYLFNYKQYMETKGIGHETWIYNKNILKHLPKNTFSIEEILYKCRSWSINKLKQLIQDKESSAIAIALVLGEKGFISKPIKDYYAQSGLMHVLAVSGLHVGLVYVFLSLLLSLIFNQKKHRFLFFLFIASLLTMYAFFSGFSASVVRAVCMCLLFELAKLFKRQISMFHALCTTAFLMLILNPDWLYDIGFQLSFMAILGISIFYETLRSIYQPQYRILKYFWNCLCLTLIAQASVTPICIYYFNAFPVYFVIANLLVLPLATINVYLCLATLIASFIPFVNSILGFITSYSLKINLIAIEMLANLPYSTIKPLWLTNWELYFFYIFFVLMYGIFALRKPVYVFVTVAAIVLGLLMKYFEWFESKNDRKAQILIYFEDLMPILIEKKGISARIFTPNPVPDANLVAWLNKLGCKIINFETYRSQKLVKCYKFYLDREHHVLLNIVPCKKKLSKVNENELPAYEVNVIYTNKNNSIQHNGRLYNYITL